jgi:predicted PhzF superfamily epimerase YddE/YHI9
MVELHVVRVFCGDNARGGNPLGVFLDGAAVAPPERQAVAADLGFSETVFVDHTETGEVRIFTPAVEIPFAGHPMVGTAWLLARTRGAVPLLRTPAREVPVRSEGGIAYAAGRPEWAPDIDFLRVGSPAEVESLDGPPPDAQPDLGVWAWIDEAAGVIRERVFAPGYGIPEDEATGSAAISLAAKLGRDLDIRQGRGSRILARLLDAGMVEIAGLVELDEVRNYQPRS